MEEARICDQKRTADQTGMDSRTAIHGVLKGQTWQKHARPKRAVGAGRRDTGAGTPPPRHTGGGILMTVWFLAAGRTPRGPSPGAGRENSQRTSQGAGTAVDDHDRRASAMRTVRVRLPPHVRCEFESVRMSVPVPMWQVNSHCRQRCAVLCKRKGGGARHPAGPSGAGQSGMPASTD